MGNKQKILKELGREEYLITFYKWKIIWNWKGWNPLGLVSEKDTKTKCKEEKQK